ncbi:MAG: DUF362 domain-containing protein [Deltaproteobacteria bacterium]|nr:DUF362 domain-containing protein [Deltaproteobacteria bacterium]
MGSKSKVLVIESSYDACTEAVARVFAAFPQQIKGKDVVVKVNALRSCNPDREAIVTHPALVKAVIDTLVTMGPGRIVVGDSVGTESYGRSRTVFDATGLSEAAGPHYRNLSLNLKVVDVEKPFKRKVAVLKDVLDADVYISLAKMKTHGMTMLSGAVKNNYGLLVGAQKSWYHFHSENPEAFAEILIEMYKLRKPDLVIMDGILAMEGYGPCSPEVRWANKVLASTDAVALDSVMGRMVGFRVDEVPYLRLAGELGLGATDLEAIEVEGDDSPLEGFNRPLVMPESTYSYLSGVGGGRTSRAFFADRVCLRPVIREEKCPSGCTACADACPSGALEAGRPPVLTSSQCMLCSACMEACEHGALQLIPDQSLRKEIESR